MIIIIKRTVQEINHKKKAFNRKIIIQNQIKNIN